ncbi:MAG: hypothetical protein KJ904_06250 [Alphaproteobacteria bacterium]|nr:hypothetical protein [Alphaproteobacteria bacterium]MBU0796396.1 hypothetical protein [Alphaproteobacteria bacterium]MBU0886747.1 hypothetical protein [Alphaproteobacteria bacterium]MBU1812640.1 hypothetical protein [Alphaproteobacteria bacterium]MBU2090900.1 hypothetical protein [Alphaproteobacteria bacterium]
MRTLTSTDYQNIHAVITLYLEELDRLGLSLTVETDMSAWVQVMRNAPKMSAVNPTFDPSQSHLHPGNSFWLRVTDNGETIACISNRLFITEDYISLKRSLRLWYDLKPVLIREPINVVIGDHVPHISGRVGHHGGLWVHPDWRGHGLAGLLPRLTRALSMRHFDVDWHCGIALKPIAARGLPLKAYGYPHMDLCIDGYFPVTDQQEEIYMGWITRPEMLKQMEETAMDSVAATASAA